MPFLMTLSDRERSFQYPKTLQSNCLEKNSAYISPNKLCKMIRSYVWATVIYYNFEVAYDYDRNV